MWPCPVDPTSPGLVDPTWLGPVEPMWPCPVDPMWPMWPMLPGCGHRGPRHRIDVEDVAVHGVKRLCGLVRRELGVHDARSVDVLAVRAAEHDHLCAHARR